MTPLTAEQQERRRASFAELVRRLGDDGAMQVVNAVDQAGMPDEAARAEMVDVLLESLRRGQEWATGESAVAIVQCPACEGLTHSRSGRGRCRACRGWGHRQVRCRACAELDHRQKYTCRECRGTQQLDPMTQRETVLRQHAEWWRKTMEEAKTTVPMHDGPPPREIAAGAKLIMPDGVVWTLNGGLFHAALDGRDCVALRNASRWEVWEHGHAETAATGAELVDAHRAMRARFAECDMRAVGEEQRRNDRDNALAKALREAVPYQHDPFVPPRPGQYPISIAKALFAAQKAIKNVPKTSDNEGDGYAYASAEAIVLEARQALHGAGLAIVPVRWHASGDVLEVWWRLVHESGEQHDCEPVEMPIVIDSGRERRAPDKALATALTYLQSQYERVLLQIPRQEPSADADARVDVGNGGRRARARSSEDERPLSQELNSIVVAIAEATERATELKALNGIQKRLEKATELPEKVVARLVEGIQKKAAALNEATAAKDPEKST